MGQIVGSRVGVMKVAAQRVGLTVDEYRHRLDSGLRWCYRDQSWEPSSEFGHDRSRADGIDRSCRRSRNAASRKNYQPKPRRSGRRYVEARDDDRLQARRRVNYFVEAGLIPAPNQLPCTDCGHVWSEGERRHEYDHHYGYAAEHHEAVDAVCTTCHAARERARRGNA